MSDSWQIPEMSEQGSYKLKLFTYQNKIYDFNKTNRFSRLLNKNVASQPPSPGSVILLSHAELLPQLAAQGTLVQKRVHVIAIGTSRALT